MCGYSYCRNCDEIVETDSHKCYMLPKLPKPCTEKLYFLIMKQDKTPEFTSQTLLWLIILMEQSLISKPMTNFANG